MCMMTCGEVSFAVCLSRYSMWCAANDFSCRSSSQMSGAVAPRNNLCTSRAPAHRYALRTSAAPAGASHSPCLANTFEISAAQKKGRAVHPRSQRQQHTLLRPAQLHARCAFSGPTVTGCEWLLASAAAPHRRRPGRKRDTDKRAQQAHPPRSCCCHRSYAQRACAAQASLGPPSSHMRPKHARCRRIVPAPPASGR